MIYLYEDPTAILRRHGTEIGRGTYRLFVLFLGTAFDEQFLKEVEKLSADIHNLTGPHAAAFLCTPPPPEPPPDKHSYAGFEALGRPSDWTEWPEFVAAMTKGSYELAKALDIPFDHLPAVVFLRPSRDEPEYAVLSLRGTSLHDMYRDIRSILGRWYQSNGALIKEIAAFKTLAKKPWDKVPNSDPDLPSFEDFARRVAVPYMSESYRTGATSDRAQEELRQRFQHLREHPRDVASVSEMLRKEHLNISIDQDVVGADDFKRYYFAVVKRLAESRYKEALDALHFPLELVAGPRRKLAVKRLFDRVDLGTIEADAGGVKFKYNPLSFLRVLLGVGDAPP